MHEWALAEGVIKTALEAGEKDGLTSISRVSVKIGELQRIKTEVFENALQTVMPQADPRLASTRIELEIEPARFRCRPCRAEFVLADLDGPVDHDQLESIHFIPELAHAFMSCPRCHSPDFEVIEGRGVWIDAVEGP
jgi:hydrogenase nickel incorporation protein HypA/HybF